MDFIGFEIIDGGKEIYNPSTGECFRSIRWNRGSFYAFTWHHCFYVNKEKDLRTPWKVCTGDEKDNIETYIINTLS